MRTTLLGPIVGAVALLCPLAQGDACADGDRDILRPAESNAPIPAVEAPVGGTSAEAHGSGGLFWGLRWDDGLRYEIGSTARIARAMSNHPDRDVRPYHGKIGLKLQLDGAAYETDGEGTTQDQGVRRARLYTSGLFFLWVPIAYKLEAEVTDEDFYIRESYVWLSEIPYVQNLKVGHFKAPMTLEGLTSSTDLLFLERAAPVEAFNPGILFGIQPAGMSEDKRRTWAIGWFADGGQNDVSEASRSPSRAIGRLTWLPRQEEGADGVNLIHVGLSGQYLYSDRHEVQFRSRPENYFAPRVVDTGTLDAEQAASWGVELAVQSGPLSVQSEFLQAVVDRIDDSNLVFQGSYIAASWLLTGESRPYKNASGVFGRVKPRREFSLGQRSFGAWELVTRISRLDLDSHDVQGGTMGLVTVGLNGYLSDRVRIAVDYATGTVERDGVDEDLRVIGGRVQYDL
jgi:phosphate-selective porin OprO/OprP